MPVKAMQHLLTIDTHRPSQAPLFGIGKDIQSALTRGYIVQRLQQLATTAGLGHSTCTGHTFRRGAATWAAEVGMAEHEIQTLGRWQSDAYKAYIEYSKQLRILLSKRFLTS